MAVPALPPANYPGSNAGVPGTPSSAFTNPWPQASRPADALTEIQKRGALGATPLGNGGALPVAITSGGGGGGGKQRTLPSVHATGDGTVAAGSVGVQFTLSSDFAGTINGLAYSGATVLTWSPPPLSVPGDTYPAIPYTITAGSANIDVLT